MNELLSRREEFIKKEKDMLLRLEAETVKLDAEINTVKTLEIERSTDVIKGAIKKSEKIVFEQLDILRKENEEQIIQMRKNFDSEKTTLESLFKEQVDAVSQAFFEKLFFSKREK
jgi:hypothetical protein